MKLPVLRSRQPLGGSATLSLQSIGDEGAPMPIEPAAAASLDPRVEAAISHWGPRFVANGVPLSDFEEVTRSVTRWEDWCGAWVARGDIHCGLGESALADGYSRSAGAHLTRAAVCYHFGKFLFVNDLAQMRAAHMKAV